MGPLAPTRSHASLALALVLVVACAGRKDPKSEPPRQRAPAEQATVFEAAFELECERAEVSLALVESGGSETDPWFDFDASGCGRKARYRASCPKDECRAERRTAVAEE